jgi:hypothetical protein
MSMASFFILLALRHKPLEEQITRSCKRFLNCILVHIDDMSELYYSTGRENKRGLRIGPE